MDDATRKVIERVSKSLIGLDPANHEHEIFVDGNDKPIVGTRTPLVEIVTDDIVTLCDAVPLEKVDQHVKDCRLGARRAGPNRKVMKQTQCLHRLLALIPMPAAPPKQEEPAAA